MKVATILLVFVVLCGTTFVSQMRVKSLLACLGYAVFNAVVLSSVAMVLNIMLNWWGWSASRDHAMQTRREMVVSSALYTVEWLDKQDRWWIEETVRGTHNGSERVLGVPAFNPEWRLWVGLSIFAGLGVSAAIFAGNRLVAAGRRSDGPEESGHMNNRS